jgi:hypothetical protein
VNLNIRPVVSGNIQAPKIQAKVGLETVESGRY